MCDTTKLPCGGEQAKTKPQLRPTPSCRPEASKTTCLRQKNDNAVSYMSTSSNQATIRAHEE